MKRILLGTTLGVALLAGAAMAGPVRDFEEAYRGMYGSYRAALFMTNSGSAEKSAGSMKAFSDKWEALMATYRAAPPPQYMDDPDWAVQMELVDMMLAKAQGEVASGALGEAHETLEGVREVFGALHLRNGVQLYSDRMNAYHAEMEHVLDMDPTTASAADLAGKAAVLEYLAAQVALLPPVEVQNTENAEYTKLMADFMGSVAAFRVAVDSGDAEAVKTAIAGLKKPYSILFLKFG